MYKFLLLALVLLISKPVFAKNDELALNDIINKFETSITNKDKDTFMQLFVDGADSWFGVYTQVDYENELKWANSKEGKALKKKIGNKFREPAKFRHSSPEIFIDSIIDNTNKPREKIANTKIISDGEIATILFDYEFYDGDRKVNYGKESWQLINTGNGWKINAVNFSISRG